MTTKAAGGVALKPSAPTARLLGDIAAAGGVLMVRTPTEADRRRLDAQIRAAHRFGLIPAGSRLIVERPNWQTCRLCISAMPEWMAPAGTPVPVARQLRTPHPAIIYLRDKAGLLDVTEPARGRALRLLQALASAAVERGHAVAAVKPLNGRDDRRSSRRDHLQFTVQGHQVALRLTQTSRRSDHVPTRGELAYKARYPHSSSIPPYDYTPGDRLRIEVAGRYIHRQSAWTDSGDSPLEGRLGEVLEEIEHRADAADRAQLNAAQQQRRSQIAEDRLEEVAAARRIQAGRVVFLDAQLAAWQRARAMTEYLDAMQACIEAAGLVEDAALAWLAWGREHVRQTDPLSGTILTPPA